LNYRALKMRAWLSASATVQENFWKKTEDCDEHAREKKITNSYPCRTKYWTVYMCYQNCTPEDVAAEAVASVAVVVATSGVAAAAAAESVAAVVLWLPVVWRVTVVAVAVGYVAAWAVATAGQK
jgi:hypothetical protein